MQNPLSVVIPCKNESANVRQCIESVRSIADEVVVADSGSTDDTIQLAKAAGCRVVERDFISFSSFKNWAIQQAKNEWVLTLDADERASLNLVSEIKKLLNCNNIHHDGYHIRRENHFCGVQLKHGPAGRDQPLRLFRKSLAEYNDVAIHESVSIASNNVGHLEHSMHHFSDRSVREYFERFNRYTSLAAQAMADRGQRPTWLKLYTAAPARFIKGYFLQLGFLDGKAGLINCALGSAYVFTKYAKLWGIRMQTQESFDRAQATEAPKKRRNAA